MNALPTDPSLAASFEALLDRLQRECGISFPPERRPDMERATRLAMARSSEADLQRYVASVAGGARSLDDVLDEITVRETYFFREPEQFAFLREVVVPDLLARRQGGPLRCWSAGCASGEEAYSLAILLEEMGAPSRIVGTDVSLAAIAEARAARYKPWSLRGEGAVRARPYLEARDDRWALSARIRRRVAFSRLNLVEDPCPPSELGPGSGCCDLVLCRNVLVYFEHRALAVAVAKLYDSLAEGGWLIAASSDPPLGGLAPFFCVPTPRGTFYRKLAARPQARENTPPPLAPEPPATRPRRPLFVAPAKLEAPPEEATPSPSPPPASASTGRDAAGLYQAAVSLIDARQDDEAIVALRQALYLDGGFVTAHLALGLALARTQQHTAALRSFRTVLRLCERLPPSADLPFAGGLSARAMGAVARERLRALEQKRKSS